MIAAAFLMTAKESSTLEQALMSSATGAAQNAARSHGTVLEAGVDSGALMPSDVFDISYELIKGYDWGDAPRFHTRYDDRDLVPIEDKALTRSSAFYYAVVTDLNAYVPAHNTRFSQPPTGNLQQDHANNRTKQLLGDVPSLLAARSEAHYLIQRVRMDTGEVICDVSVPVVVRGKHRGCARVGFRRTE